MRRCPASPIARRSDRGQVLLLLGPREDPDRPAVDALDRMRAVVRRRRRRLPGRDDDRRRRRAARAPSRLRHASSRRASCHDSRSSTTARGRCPSRRRRQRRARPPTSGRGRRSRRLRGARTPEPPRSGSGRGRSVARSRRRARARTATAPTFRARRPGPAPSAWTAPRARGRPGAPQSRGSGHVEERVSRGARRWPRQPVHRHALSGRAQGDLRCPRDSEDHHDDGGEEAVRPDPLTPLCGEHELRGNEEEAADRMPDDDEREGQPVGRPGASGPPLQRTKEQQRRDEARREQQRVAACLLRPLDDEGAGREQESADEADPPPEETIARERRASRRRASSRRPTGSADPTPRSRRRVSTATRASSRASGIRR